MRTKKILLNFNLIVIGLFLFVGGPAHAGLYNPNFDLGLSGWLDLSSGGSVTVDSGVATLTAGEGVSTSGAVLTQGDDGSFAFSAPVVIPKFAHTFEFDLWLLDNQVDNAETGTSIFSDSLTLFIFDAVDLSFDHIFDSLEFNPALTHYSFNISSLADRSVAFSFQLADEDNGFNLSLGVDNLKIGVPESNLLVLFLLCVSTLLFARSIQRFRVSP